jgi:hypothetical protein
VVMAVAKLNGKVAGMKGLCSRCFLFGILCSSAVVADVFFPIMTSFEINDFLCFLKNIMFLSRFPNTLLISLSLSLSLSPCS